MGTSEKSKILVIGGTGYLGKFIIQESAKEHPTFALVREASLSDPVKRKTVQNFKDLGITILHGDLNDHESLVKAIKQVDVVISTVGRRQLLDQTKIISAIKEAGNVKRFLPSEYGTDLEKTKNAVEPAKSSVFVPKTRIRRSLEAEVIPYTYIVSNCSFGFYLPTLGQFKPRLTVPPRDKITILGDGNVKVVFNKEEDIAAYMIKAVDDPRTLNKSLYIYPPKNILSMNEVVALWEEKIGKYLEKIYISEEHLLESIEDSPISVNILLSINHLVFVKGEQLNFTGLEASELYPDVKYTRVEEYISHFV